MDEKDWILLDTLYTEKNITKTAQRLYVSQPSLTYRIHQIEQKFGVEIIVRRKTGVEFTVEGGQIALYARKMLLELQRLQDSVSNTANTVKGVLRLAVSSSFAHYRLPELLKNFLDNYPDVEINVTTGWSSEVLQSVHKEEVHIGILRGETQWHDHKCRLSTEPIYIVSQHKLDLQRLPYIPRINYKTDYQLKAVIDSWWQSKYKSLPPLASMEVDNIETCKELVKRNLGYAILPNVCLQEKDGLTTHPLTTPDGEMILRDTWMICRDGLRELSFIRAFLNFANGYF